MRRGKGGQCPRDRLAHAVDSSPAKGRDHGVGEQVTRTPRTLDRETIPRVRLTNDASQVPSTPSNASLPFSRCPSMANMQVKLVDGQKVQATPADRFATALKCNK